MSRLPPDDSRYGIQFKKTVVTSNAEAGGRGGQGMLLDSGWELTCDDCGERLDTWNADHGLIGEEDPDGKLPENHNASLHLLSRRTAGWLWPL